jgi:hypothetical protein
MHAKVQKMLSLQGWAFNTPAIEATLLEGKVPLQWGNGIGVREAFKGGDKIQVPHIGREWQGARPEGQRESSVTFGQL